MTKESLIIVSVILLCSVSGFHYHRNSLTDKIRDLKDNCPKVKPIRNFDLNGMMGFWYVLQYYASSEETSEYSCMKSNFSTVDNLVTMNFTYIYENDPANENLQGNLTWRIPNYDIPSHWIHTEDTYEGIYNTYIIDTDNGRSWGLIMHCAEKTDQPRYLSALLLSREPKLGENVVNFLREKLPRYDIDTSFMFAINQTDCNVTKTAPIMFTEN